MDSRDHCSRLSVMVALLVLHRWEVARGTVQPPTVPPVDPRGDCELDLLRCTPGTAPMDELGLVETHHGFRERVVVAVAA